MTSLRFFSLLQVTIATTVDDRARQEQNGCQTLQRLTRGRATMLLRKDLNIYQHLLILLVKQFQTEQNEYFMLK